MAIFRSVLKGQFEYFLMTWFVVAAFNGVFAYFIREQHELVSLGFTFWFSGFVGSLFSAKIRFFQERYFSVLKSNCKNIRLLWFLVFFQNYLLLVFSVAFFILWRLVFKIELLPQISVWEYVSYLVLIYLVMCCIDGNQLVDRAQLVTGSRKEIAKQVLLVVFAMVFASILIWVYRDYSALLALTVAALAFVFMFSRTDEFVKTIPKNINWKITSALSGVVIFVQVCLGFADYKLSTTQNFVLRPEHTWSYADIKNVKTIEDWILWQNKLSSLAPMTAEQVIGSYEILAQLCPPVPRDTPLVVSCVGVPGYVEYQSTGKTLRSEEDVLKLMSASTEYAQIMGLLYARKLKKPLSKDLILAIEYIAEKESTIQGLARNTLTFAVPDNYIGVLKIQTNK
ncbi:MAG: hypothetical protein IT287_02795 [Bdellovibrionaceae bacterium]|nr:hypothetical protein [Pseudobdellovibrionaceae bacterium]